MTPLYGQPPRNAIVAFVFACWLFGHDFFEDARCTNGATGATANARTVACGAASIATAWAKSKLEAGMGDEQRSEATEATGAEAKRRAFLMDVRRRLGPYTVMHDGQPWRSNDSELARSIIAVIEVMLGERP